MKTLLEPEEIQANNYQERQTCIMSSPLLLLLHLQCNSPDYTTPGIILTDSAQQKDKNIHYRSMASS